MGIFGKSDTRTPEPAPAPRPPGPVHAAPAAASPSSAPAPSRGTPCVIGPRVQLKGELSGAEAVVVSGSVEGTVKLTAELRVAPGGSVKADVTANTLVIAGELDPFGGPVSEEMAAALPDPPVVTIPGPDHFVFLEPEHRPDWSRAVLDFLGS